MTADPVADKSKIRVLVTGASGYLAIHCVQQLLADGYTVRGTVRSLKNADKVDPLRALEGAAERLELVEADLIETAHVWPSLLTGCEAVLHVASPWPIIADQRTIDVAVNGTLTVLRAATTSTTVRKVVLTSSCAAVNDGHRNDERVFDETCWTNLENTPGTPHVDDYARSKTLAERAAWEYWRSCDPATRYELTVINPTFVIGPVLSAVEHGSATIVGRMLHFHTFLAAPKVCLGVVDVRDVARAHIRAMEDQSGATNGERILITNERPTWMQEMCTWLGAEFRPHGFAITPIVAPNWLIRLYARTGIDEISTATLHRLGPQLCFSNRKSVELLNMEYRDPHKSLLEMAHSLLAVGLVPPATTPRLAKKLRSLAPGHCRRPRANKVDL